jgi:hypothetical protein
MECQKLQEIHARLFQESHEPLDLLAGRHVVVLSQDLLQVDFRLRPTLTRESRYASIKFQGGRIPVGSVAAFSRCILILLLGKCDAIWRFSGGSRPRLPRDNAALINFGGDIRDYGTGLLSFTRAVSSGPGFFPTSRPHGLHRRRRQLSATLPRTGQTRGPRDAMKDRILDCMAKGVALERRVGAQRERLAKLGTRQRRRWLWAAWVLTVFAAVVPSLGVGELPSMRTPVLSEVHLEGANSALATCCLARFCGVPNRLRGGGGECAPSSEVETEEEDEDTGPDALYTAQQVCPNPPCCLLAPRGGQSTMGPP